MNKYYKFLNTYIPRKIHHYFWLCFDNSFAFFYHLIRKEEIENVRLNVPNLKWGIKHYVASRRIDKRAIQFLCDL